MPNRFIKESICKSETLEQLTAEEERLFYRLLVNCDDFGRFDAKPSIVKNECFRLDEGKIKISFVGKCLKKLQEVGLILLYENKGKKYLQFLTWSEHQQQRATKSKYPGPCDEGSFLISIDNKCYQEKTNESTLNTTIEGVSGNLISSDINSNQVISIAARASNTISNTNTDISLEKGVVGGKTNYAENVSMTPEEYKKLIDKYGESDTKLFIEKLDNSKGSKGYVYKSDYRAILNWVVGEVVGKREKEKKITQSKPANIGNHNQRPPPTDDEIDKLCKI